MTEEEAIKILNGTDLFVSNRAFLEYQNAIILAINALKKRVPITPDIWGGRYTDMKVTYDKYCCPSCNKSYELEYEKYSYCPNCGQAIDWSEKE